MANSNTARASDIAQPVTTKRTAFLRLAEDGVALLEVPAGVPVCELLEQSVVVLRGTSELMRLAEENELIFGGGQPAADVMCALAALVNMARGMTSAALEAQAFGGAQ